MRRTSPVIWALALLIFALSPARAAMSPEEQKAILDYKLSMPIANKLLAALPEMTKYVLSLPDWQTRLARSAKLSSQERLKEMEQSPQVMAILKKNGLTAKEYAVGVVALRMAIWSASPGGAPGPNIIASPENLAFAKANLADLKPRMDAADGTARQR